MTLFNQELTHLNRLNQVQNLMLQGYLIRIRLKSTLTRLLSNSKST